MIRALYPGHQPGTVPPNPLLMDVIPKRSTRLNYLLLAGLASVAFLLLGGNLPRLGSGYWRPAAPGRAAGSGYEVIDLVNRLRAANGLVPYKVNDALMAAAQGHSEWMAETGATSHTGAGGSSPAGRAAGAGYPGSGVVENIASGSNMTPAGAVQIWQGDSLHLNTMLSSASQDAGAGVAVSGDGVTYITLDVGNRGGGSGSGASGSASGQGQSETSGGAAAPSTPPTPEVIVPVQTATTQPDGSVIHVVEPGQALWNVATAYQINLNDLYALNGLNAQSVIFPGEHLLVRGPSQTLTPTRLLIGPDATGTGTESTSGTLTPGSPQTSPTTRPATKIASPPARSTPVAAVPSAVARQAAESQAAPAETSTPPVDPLLVIIGGIAVVGAGLVLVGSLLRRGP